MLVFPVLSSINTIVYKLEESLLNDATREANYTK